MAEEAQGEGMRIYLLLQKKPFHEVMGVFDNLTLALRRKEQCELIGRKVSGLRAAEFVVRSVPLNGMRIGCTQDWRTEEGQIRENVAIVEDDANAKPKK